MPNPEFGQPEQPNLPEEESATSPQVNAEVEPVNMDSQSVIEKAEQGTRILSTLWEKRLEILKKYYKTKGPGRQEVLTELAAVNTREETVIGIFENGAGLGARLLKAEGEKVGAEVTPELAEYDHKIATVEKTLERYTELVNLHKDIIEIEKEFIEHPEDQSFQLYLKRMGLFNSEFNTLHQEENEEIKKYFQDIENDLQKIDETSKKKNPLAHLPPSIVSAVVRVGVANVLAGVVVGNPFENPYFWKLSGMTIPAVLAINYADYYFKVFTRLTNKINETLNIK